MNNLKEEFENKLSRIRILCAEQGGCSLGIDVMSSVRANSINKKSNELWQWIETQIMNARMEQDTINFNSFLEKQDSITIKAKIEEDKWLIEEMNRKDNEPLMFMDLRNRISELEKELK